MGSGIGQMAGGLMQIFSSMDEGNAESDANRRQYVREHAAANEAITGAIERGEFESGRLRMQGAMTAAKQKTAFANSGVDASSGTAANVQADTYGMGAKDAQQAQINAAREVWGFKEQKKQAGEEYESRQAGINRKQTYGILGGFTKWGAGAIGSGFSGGGGG
jgi:hypothetical protein